MTSKSSGLTGDIAVSELNPVVIRPEGKRYEALTLYDFERAVRLIHTVLQPTPVKRSDWLSKKTGKEVWLKLEVIQPTNSFKIRGAVHSLLLYKETYGSFPGKVICASGGSHGLGMFPSLFATHPIIFI